MPTHSTTAPADRLAKRARLKELVERLGSDATPAVIREHAYREGIGQVNTPMLVFVRNELWPAREKRGGGRPKGANRTALTAMPAALPGLSACPSCGSQESRVKSVYKRQGTRRSRAGDAAPGSVWRRRKCSSCGSEFGTINEPGVPLTNKRRLMHAAATEKGCSKCGRTLPVSCFGKMPGDDTLYRSHCKDCSCEDRALLGFKKTLQKYGITQDQYDSILAAQGGNCAICHRPGGGSKRERWQPLVFDHSHVTGKFRGLLCAKCNLGLGNFDDRHDFLEAAAAYLRSHAD